MRAGAGGSSFEDAPATSTKGTTMSDTLNRPAVNLGPVRAHPGLALAFALLAIPGTTIAWDLPAGGLWIGLPLAVAALVLGIRARRQQVRSGIATAAIAIGTLAIAQMVLYAAVQILS
jgi:predicted Kef-type K+ transport protein